MKNPLIKKSNDLSGKELKQIIRTLRGKTKLPQVDLRKNVNRQLSKSQKTQIVRKWNSLQRETGGNTTVQLFKVRRNPNESRNKYAKRVRQLKAESGQKGSQLNGILYAIPPGTKLRSRKGKPEFYRPGQPGYREIIVGIDPKKMTNRRTRERYLRQLLKRHGKGFDAVKIKLGNHRSGFTSDPGEPEQLIDQLNQWLNQYGRNTKTEFLDEVINGLILIEYGD